VKAIKPVPASPASPSKISNPKSDRRKRKVTPKPVSQPPTVHIEVRPIQHFPKLTDVNIEQANKQETERIRQGMRHESKEKDQAQRNLTPETSQLKTGSDSSPTLDYSSNEEQPGTPPQLVQKEKRKKTPNTQCEVNATLEAAINEAMEMQRQNATCVAVQNAELKLLAHAGWRKFKPAGTAIYGQATESLVAAQCRKEIVESQNEEESFPIQATITEMTKINRATFKRDFAESKEYTELFDDNLSNCEVYKEDDEDVEDSDEDTGQQVLTIGGKMLVTTSRAESRTNTESNFRALQHDKHLKKYDLVILDGAALPIVPDESNALETYFEEHVWPSTGDDGLVLMFLPVPGHDGQLLTREILWHVSHDATVNGAQFAQAYQRKSLGCA
jgi:hypothetical protein